MKKTIFIAICTVSLISLASCGSTAPCGLSKKTDNIQKQLQQEIVVAEAAAE